MSLHLCNGTIAQLLLETPETRCSCEETWASFSASNTDPTQSSSTKILSPCSFSSFYESASSWNCGSYWLYQKASFCYKHDACCWKYGRVCLLGYYLFSKLQLQPAVACRLKLPFIIFKSQHLDPNKLESKDDFRILGFSYYHLVLLFVGS